MIGIGDPNLRQIGRIDCIGVLFDRFGSGLQYFNRIEPLKAYLFGLYKVVACQLFRTETSNELEILFVGLYGQLGILHRIAVVLVDCQQLIHLFPGRQPCSEEFPDTHDLCFELFGTFPKCMQCRFKPFDPVIVLHDLQRHTLLKSLFFKK